MSVVSSELQVREKVLALAIYIPDQTEIHSYFVCQLLVVPSHCYCAACMGDWLSGLRYMINELTGSGN
jgi:hypothetical protein